HIRRSCLPPILILIRMCRRSVGQWVSMPELAIIADDLTGALDTAAPFAMRGLSTHAALGVDSISEALSAGPRVLTVSTDSREVAPDIARKRVAEIVAVLPKGTKIFKKIDSRLKGNIAAE